MSTREEKERYISSVEKELEDIRKDEKASIMKEIREKLNEKIANILLEEEIPDITPDQFREIVEEMGRPGTVAKSYIKKKE